MKQLLIAAHGSRRESSNDEVRALVAQVADNLGVAFDGVEVAFLELATPSVESVLSELFKGQTKEVVLLPYFLSAGIHVVKDIPEEIDKALSLWPDKKITVLPHIGAFDVMASVIAKACQH
ncbi:MAG: CbiX/SirB N-terminal domain-containing protein [Oceanospirillaceae bacterium]|nr:CbiX/SirB N-terminal domain-containing protein [Oceanospirillaceae bacterium]